MVRCQCKGQVRKGKGKGKGKDKGKCKGFQGVRKGDRVHRWCGRVDLNRGQRGHVTTGEGQAFQYLFLSWAQTGEKRGKNVQSRRVCLGENGDRLGSKCSA
jgi:hypothetical protein